MTQVIPPTTPFFVFAVIYGFFRLFGFKCWTVIWVGQPLSHSINANHTVFGLFVHWFNFGDKDDKILT